MDKGTGKEANITITASTNLSDDEVERAVKEAEKFAEEDKKRKESIEVRQCRSISLSNRKAIRGIRR